MAGEVAWRWGRWGWSTTVSGLSTPTAVAQRPAPLTAMHPAAPCGCVSVPAWALRLKIAMASLFEEATYTFLPSGLRAMAREPMKGPGPLRARAGPQPLEGA